MDVVFVPCGTVLVLFLIAFGCCCLFFQRRYITPLEWRVQRLEDALSEPEPEPQPPLPATAPGTLCPCRASGHLRDLNARGVPSPAQEAIAAGRKPREGDTGLWSERGIREILTDPRITGKGAAVFTNHWKSRNGMSCLA